MWCIVLLRNRTGLQDKHINSTQTNTIDRTFGPWWQRRLRACIQWALWLHTQQERENRSLLEKFLAAQKNRRCWCCDSCAALRWTLENCPKTIGREIMLHCEESPLSRKQFLLVLAKHAKRNTRGTLFYTRVSGGGPISSPRLPCCLATVCRELCGAWNVSWYTSGVRTLDKYVSVLSLLVYWLAGITGSGTGSRLSTVPVSLVAHGQ